MGDPVFRSILKIRIYSYLYVSIHPLTIVTINFKMDGQTEFRKDCGPSKKSKKVEGQRNMKGKKLECETWEEERRG